MSLLYFDGFDDYSTAQIPRYWTIHGGAQTIQAGVGRNSTGTLQMAFASNSNWIGHTFAPTQTVIIGFAFKVSILPSNFTTSFGAFYDSGVSQIDFWINSDGTLELRRNNAAITGGRSTLAISAGIWYYIEIKLKILASIATGDCTLTVNGVQWVTVTAGQSSKNTGNTTGNELILGDLLGSGAMPQFNYDDLYIDNGTTLLGDVRVETIFATGAGATTNWTPLSGANWQNVSHNPATDDTNYNSDGTAGDIDLYTYPVIATAAGAVQAVMTVPVMKNDSAGTVTAQSVYRSGGTNYFGTTVTVPSTTYAAFPDIQVNDPNTSSPWTVAGVNACQYGIKRVT